MLVLVLVVVVVAVAVVVVVAGSVRRRDTVFSYAHSVLENLVVFRIIKYFNKQNLILKYHINKEGAYY